LSSVLVTGTKHHTLFGKACGTACLLTTCRVLDVGCYLIVWDVISLSTWLPPLERLGHTHTTSCAEYLDGVLGPIGAADSQANSILGHGLSFLVGRASYTFGLQVFLCLHVLASL